MTYRWDTDAATADALTLLLHNQHAITVALEELNALIIQEGDTVVADNAFAALHALDAYAKTLTEAIILVRGH